MARKVKRAKDEAELESEQLVEWHAGMTEYVDFLASENHELRNELENISKQLDRLRLENLSLRKDNDTLKQKSTVQIPVPLTAVSMHVPPVPAPHPSTTINFHSQTPNTDHISLYMSLFRGRSDVFAERWDSDGKSGYSPACAIKFDRRFCGIMSKKKCENCKYIPFTEKTVANHLSGRIVAGVYPLMRDETCWFLAVDFDKENWQRDAKAFLRTSADFQVPAYLERSRSGNGGHIWIFFNQPIAANLARKLGSAILTKTMEVHHELNFSSYDRFFPNQDTMPNGGFGNLIALPLQGKSLQSGNSVFLTEDFSVHPNQWEYLASIKKISFESISSIVNSAERDGAVVGVRLASTDDNTADPWTIPPSKKRSENKITCVLPERIKITQSNLLYFDKDNLPPKFLNLIKRLAAFQNPEFYKKQAMRMPIYKIPRIICCAEDFPKFLAIPRGCLDEVLSILTSHKITADIVDERTKGVTIDVQFKGELRQNQRDAVRDLMSHDIGVLSATTAFGKTVVGSWMIAARKVNTLILVNRQQLMDQWRERLSVFLNLPISSIGQIGGGKNKSNGFIDVAMLQSLSKKDVVKDLVANYGHVIVDECHHIAAFSFEAVLKQVKAKFVLGLTATPVRKDGHHPIILMQCGQIRYRTNLKQQAQERPFEHIVNLRRTPFQSSAEKPAIHDLYEGLTKNRDRNKMIIEDVKKALAEGRNPLILTERKAHIDTLIEEIGDSVKHLIVMTGGMKKGERANIFKTLGSIPPHESRLLIATGKYIGEGFDDPRLDTLFLVLPISWSGTLQQYVGRLHRLHEWKTEVQVFDYVDDQVPMLARMFEKRRKGYLAMGYSLSDTSGTDKRSLFD